jgi:hypothetical protein
LFNDKTDKVVGFSPPFSFYNASSHIDRDGGVLNGADAFMSANCFSMYLADPSFNSSVRTEAAMTYSSAKIKADYYKNTTDIGAVPIEQTHYVEAHTKEGVRVYSDIKITLEAPIIEIKGETLIAATRMIKYPLFGEAQIDVVQTVENDFGVSLMPGDELEILELTGEYFYCYDWFSLETIKITLTVLANGTFYFIAYGIDNIEVGVIHDMNAFYVAVKNTGSENIVGIKYSPVTQQQ